MTDLARLVVALEAQTAKYQAGLDAANRRLERFQREQNTRLTQIGRKFTAFTGGVRGALAAVGVGISFRAIIEATSEAEKAFALLDNAVKATGGSAGFTTEQLAEYATQLQRVSTYDDEAIMGAEQLLLRFRSIQGANFTTATKTVLDLATALNMDLQSAAQLVGKALEDPIKGMTQLARSGVVLGDAQKKLIKDLVGTGQQAKAQEILLQELQKRYGGAAEAARNTFGGALAGLKNAFNDLLEGKSGMPQATEAINNLTEVLNSEEVKKGFEIIVGGLAKAVEWAAKAAAGIAGFAKSVGEFFGELAAGTGGMSAEQLQKRIDLAEQLRESALKFNDAQAPIIKQYDEQIRQLKEQLALRKEYGEFGSSTPEPAPGPPKPAPFKPIVSTTGGQTKDTELTDSIVTATKAYQSAMDKLYAQWDQDTQTALEKSEEDWAEFVGKIAELQKIPIEQGGITAEQALERLKEYNNTLLTEVEVTVKRINQKHQEYVDQYAEFLKEAARNTQDILANGLYDAMTGKFDDILAAFIDMITKMVAQALAADINGALFGKNGSGGWIGAGLNWLGGLFGGTRDSGGRGAPGKVYKIGTGAQPEYFAPDQAGSFFPADMVGARAGGGGRGLVQNFYYDKPPTERTVRQQQRDAARGLRQAARLS